MKKWMQVAEAAEVMKVSERTLHSYIKAGKVETKKEHGKRLILVEVPDAETEASQEESEATEVLQEESESTDEAYLQLMKEKDARITDLQMQVQQLTEQADRLTQLLAMEQKNVGQLTEQNQLLLEDQRQPKPSLWQRLTQRKQQMA